MSKKYTILVIEDKTSLLKAIKLKLEKDDFNVFTARSAGEAFGYLEGEQHIDVIWSDHYLLGKEDGLDFVKHCKEGGSKCQDIPIFIISNTATSDKVQEYIKLGINRYYVKAEERIDGIVEDIKKELAGKE